jgi:P4 family phage/plasmid primase-like protien
MEEGIGVSALKGDESLKKLLFETAERYVKEGLQIVCVHSAWCDNKIKRGKAPTHFGWQKEALRWEELRKEMERVWSREGGCNIGLKTGKESGLVCVDVDPKSGGLGWYNEHEMHLGSPIVERTANGGMHLYYRYPQGLEGELKTCSSLKRLFKGVDILADGAGQVVTWPSVHASGEVQYTFDRGLDLIDAAVEADELPRWIVDEMLLKQREDKNIGESEGKRGEAEEIDLQAARFALESVAGAVEGDGGDLQTLRAAMVCRDYGLSEKQVYELLLSEYNPRCSPPWQPKELWAKVKNAFKYGRMSQGSASISNAFSEEPTVPVERTPEDGGSAADDAYSKKNAIHSARVFMKRNKRFVDCYDGQFVYYDAVNHRWKVTTDNYMESIIYRDISMSCGDGELIRTMKVGHISDIRKAVKFHLNNAQVIPDVYWRSGERKGMNYITMANGILDVESGELLGHTEDWFCFQSIGVTYDESARCPMFLKFLEDVWDGDEELIESLRLWMGYCLLSSANLQKFAIFKGASRAGKSTLAGVIEALVGRDNSASTSLSLIGSDFGLENIMGRKLVVFQDADRASQDRMGVATERIKSLASNDPMGINRKGQSVVFQRMNAKIAFVCNKMPPFLNDENALTNRMVVFPFWKSFQGKEDFTLGERLEQEIPGVFNWALVGARRLLRGDKLFTAQKGLEALEEITQQLDSVQGFMAECVEVTDQEHNVVTATDLWAAYKEWCKDSGRVHKNKQRFFMELGNHRVMATRRVRTKELRGFRGVRLMSDVFASVPDIDDCPF